MSAPATMKAREFLPYHRASIAQEEMDAVMQVLRSGWLTTGPRVAEFEANFARYVGAPHAVAVSSCTAALHLALTAVGVTEGDEVIVPAMTFAASGETILYHGARPVLVDCKANSYHLDLAEVERAITPRTRAIVPVHYGGEACDMDALLDIARSRGFKVVEDAAHALPCKYKNKTIGTLGDITCFSFYATKTMTTGEGGMITTASKEYADRVRLLSLHGISKNGWKRYTNEGTWRYDIEDVGYKYNMTDLQAALGLAQLPKCDSMCERRAAVAARYNRALSTLDSIATPKPAQDSTNAWHLYVIEVNSPALRIGRDQVIEQLRSRGIGTSVHFIPLHLHSLYQQLGYREGQFPNAEERFGRVISLPIYPGMTESDADRVIEALFEIDREYRR